MKNTIRFARPFGCRAFAAALAAFVGFAAATTRAAIPPPEKLLPDDTLVVLTMPDFAKVREIYRTSPQTQLWTDPAMKPFKDKFLAKLNEELIQPLERDLGVRLDDFASLPQGQLTFAVTQNGSLQSGEEASPGFLLLLDTKDRAVQLKTNLAAIRRKWADAGKPVRTEKIRGLDFNVFLVSEKDTPPSLKKVFSSPDEEESTDGSSNKPPGSELVFGQFESLLVVGNAVKPVEKVIVHLTGGAMPALGDQAAFEANRVAMFRDAPLYAWVNVKAFVDLLMQHTGAPKTEEDPLAAFSPGKLLAATGLGSVRTLAFSVQSSSDGTFFHFLVSIPESSRQGPFKLYPGEAKESSPPPFVPADAVNFQRWRIDGQKAWATLEKMAGDISPQLTSYLNFIIDTANKAAREKDPAFDVKKNLFGNLGDDVITYQKAPRGSSLDALSSPPTLYLIGSPHADQLTAAIKSVLALLNQQGGPPADREFLGRKIFSQPLPALPLPGSASGGARRTLSYAANGNYVAITTDTSMLEEYLRSGENPPKALRETPGLTEAAARVGGSTTGLFGYENQGETTRVLIETLKKVSGAPGANAAPGIPAWNPEPFFKDWLDFSLLPPFEKIAKYFSFSVYAGSANVDGLSFKMYAPVPPGLKK